MTDKERQENKRRQAEYIKRQKEKGLVQRWIWVKPRAEAWSKKEKKNWDKITYKITETRTDIDEMLKSLEGKQDEASIVGRTWLNTANNLLRTANDLLKGYEPQKVQEALETLEASNETAPNVLKKTSDLKKTKKIQERWTKETQEKLDEYLAKEELEKN